MNIGNGYHLSYCSNIHPGEEWDKVFENLKIYIPALKKNISPEKPFGIGLRLSDVASRELIKDEKLSEFKSWLTQNDAYVFTLNGFPYGGFHRQVVKDDVHTPDWRTKDRVDYTIRLSHILSALLPEGMDGGISTSPLSYKPWLKKDEKIIHQAFHEGAEHYARIAEELAKINKKTGKLIHLDIEPEPDGLIENTKEVIDFYSKWLLPVGIDYLKESMALSASETADILKKHIQICYDVCHFAVGYEKPEEVFSRLAKTGIKIGKIQISAALKVNIPEDIEQRREIEERLRPFAESTYLHQVVERNSNGTLNQFTDLSIALESLHKTKAVEWRTHFHVPIFMEDYQGLQSTQKDIITVLNLLKDQSPTHHLEIETYTWDVLPKDMKLDMQSSIQRELEWVLNQMSLRQDSGNTFDSIQGDIS